ncbi:uncharacterized protein LOC129780533 [Toxorhynchites rutilus septentrionalis]|uniref:uncharacterized protein LOC129780533 n=1 Tax=Toxorhynchites rutilus septentrionalis TaxID=329112 RepID=UPI002479D56D|nr:uncharacterized protein LOC129780533 [Toxorhynchites rutilus septentrionalis]XP_055644867.1 uncharacterized protein LOC129780533 [Toxorhynchites rutilus septentrionalis]XP_055644868.1 uncharacterized protein LOC129780533 [Toxorhynchites rutilus septentrionalis]
MSKVIPDVMEDEPSNGLDDGSATRRGRFRVSAPPAGPPETTVGRFRLIPQTGTYGPASPFLQRGRFSVIPEEPQNSPSSTMAPLITVTDRQASPDWDFDDEKTVSGADFIGVGLELFAVNRLFYDSCAWSILKYIPKLSGQYRSL